LKWYRKTRKAIKKAEPGRALPVGEMKIDLED